jgi:capsular polysaccharide biosynthesis protein
MDLKEYLAIFKKNFKFFVTIVVLFMIAGILFQLFRPLNYKSNLTLNVTRAGSQETPDYRYDDFYRLQADERFADTAVRWLGTQRIVTDILNDSKITTSGMSGRRLSKFFKGQRLSSQLVEVSYIAASVSVSQDLANSILKRLDLESEKLNRDQKEEYWFKLVGNDPVIKENKYSWLLMISAALLLGIFTGFWMVLIRHYLSNNI